MWARKAWNTFLEATIVDARVPISDACLSAPNAVGADTDIVEGEGDYVGVAVVDVVVVVRDEKQHPPSLRDPTVPFTPDVISLVDVTRRPSSPWRYLGWSSHQFRAQK